MLRHEFTNTLAYYLAALPAAERDKAISYYTEIISDKVEEGKPEAEIIDEFGDIYALAQGILAENNMYFAQPNKKQGLSGGQITLLIFGILFSPVLLGLGICLVALVFSLVVMVFSISFALFISALACAITGLVLFVTSFITIFSDPLLGALQIGGSLVCLGLSVFIFAGGYFVAKGAIKLTMIIVDGIKKLFSKKDRQAYRMA